MPAALPLPVLALLALFVHSAPAAEAPVHDWYRIDVLLFKPVNPDLDGEAWPEADPAYPADLVAVFGPRALTPLQLAQLETPDDPLMPQEAREANRPDGAGVLPEDRDMTKATTADEAAAALPADEAAAAALPADEAAPEDVLADIKALLADENPLSPGQLAFSNTESQSSLRGILRNLARSSLFEVLSHHSWIQPVGETPTSVLMQAGRRHDNRFEVEGVLSFSRSRYLHTRTNLWYTQFEPAGLPPALVHSSAYAKAPAQERAGAGRTHVMAQARRMRSGELHYIDHPLLGVIIRISRFAPPSA